MARPAQKFIVVEVYEYGAVSAEAAEADVRMMQDTYEHPSFCYAAPSLDELPHPSQVEEIRKAFSGD